MMSVAARTLTVTNCGDHGTGTLRELLTSAQDGDEIFVNCSRVTLTTGRIAASAPHLTIVGRGPAQTSVSGTYNDSIIVHAAGGSGTVSGGLLTLKDIALTEGASNDSVGGGCVFSQASVTLQNSVVSYCSVGSNQNDGFVISGGAIYAKQDIKLYGSVVASGRLSSTFTDTKGGALKGRYVSLLPALDAQGNYIAGTGSTIARSSAYSTNSYGLGGAIYGTRVYSLYSTVYGNKATTVGAIFAKNIVALSGSTISGNVAVSHLNTVGGVVLSGYALTGTTAFANVVNSTIAFNTGTVGGIQIFEGTSSAFVTTAEFHDSIFSNSTKYTGAAWFDVESEVPITGGGNIIVSATGPTSSPSDTIEIDPMLQPLGDNGGMTVTHMPKSRSVAFNSVLSQNATRHPFPRHFASPGLDQRGFARNARGDIGGVNETIFGSGFD